MLLVRGARLAQAIITVGLGFVTFHHAWLEGVATGIAVWWSAFLAWSAWRRTGCSPSLGVIDVVIALLVLAATGVSTPPSLITTSFYWALPYAQSAALVAAGTIGLRPRLTVLAPIVLIATYGLVVYLGAGQHELPAGSGNAVGIAAFFAVGAVVAPRVRRQSRRLDQAQADARWQEEDLAVRRTRLAEFRRLHDDALQVLERVSATDQPRSPQLREYARQAATRLRMARVDTEDQHFSLKEELTQVACRFDETGFAVDLQFMSALPCVDRTTGRLLCNAVREALTNARKHSRTNRAAVRVLATAGGVGVRVADKGVGFEPLRARKGFGLENSIKGRLAEAEGTVEVESSPGEGTVVTMWIPC
jgi:signal transduction histidine kinase